MALVTVNDTTLTDIADAIRSKNGQETLYKPSEMPDAIEAISGGGITPTGTKEISITENGTTTEDVTNYASAEISVSVPNSYGAADEGKVVSNGALVAQTSDTVTSNDTYDTTLINSLTVNVSGSSLPARVLDYQEITMASTATQSNKVTVSLVPSTLCYILIMIDTWPASPDSTEYIALYLGLPKFPLSGAGAASAILRPAGTIGSDSSMVTFNTSTGELQLGGQYGHFMVGTKYHIWQFEVGASS